MTLTDRFPRVELGLGVSWYVSLILGSQCVQLVFDDVLTFSHTEEAVAIAWRDRADQTRRHHDVHNKGMLNSILQQLRGCDSEARSGQYCSECGSYNDKGLTDTTIHFPLALLIWAPCKSWRTVTLLSLPLLVETVIDNLVFLLPMYNSSVNLK